MLTLEWIDGIKLTDRDALIAAGHDLQGARRDPGPRLPAPGGGRRLLPCRPAPGQSVRAARRPARGDRLRHHGPDRPPARIWLAEILYGLITGNYRRVAEIHFEAQYVPPHHNIDEFATALRAVGEPMRGLPVKEISVGQMLDGLFAITRDFDMQTQPHLLLLQKTMVMEEGVATALDPDINMWETAEPFLQRMGARRARPRGADRRRDRPHRPAAPQAARPDPPDRPLLPAARAPRRPTPPLPEIAIVRPHRYGLVAAHCLRWPPRLARRRSAPTLRRCGASASSSSSAAASPPTRRASCPADPQGGRQRALRADRGRRAVRHADDAGGAVRAAGPYQPVGPQGRGRDGPYPAVAARPTWSWSARRPPTCWRRWRPASPTISPPPCCSPPTSRCSPRRR